MTDITLHVEIGCFPLRRMRLMIRVVKDLRTGKGVAAESRITLARAITKDAASRHAGGTHERDREKPGRRNLVRAQTYEITFLGQAGTTLQAEFDDCQVTVGPGTTTVRAEIPDRGALSGLIERINSLGLDVIDVNLVAPPVQQLPAQVTHRRVVMMRAQPTGALGGTNEPACSWLLRCRADVRVPEQARRRVTVSVQHGPRAAATSDSWASGSACPGPSMS